MHARARSGTVLNAVDKTVRDCNYLINHFHLPETPFVASTSRMSSPLLLPPPEAVEHEDNNSHYRQVLVTHAVFDCNARECLRYRRLLDLE